MRLLADTQLLIWGSQGDRRLSPAATALLEGADEAFFSVASIWEIAIKQAKRLPGFDVEVDELRDGLLANAYTELPVLGHHALEVANLPRLHGDPFDRLLLAQARAEGLTLLTADRAFAAYGAPVHLA